VCTIYVIPEHNISSRWNCLKKNHHEEIMEAILTNIQEEQE
jgi:hypothetical protein